MMRSEMFAMGRWHCYWLMLVHQAPWVGWLLLVITVGIAVAGFLVSTLLGVAALGIDAFIVVMAMSFVIMTYGFYSITGVNMSRHSLVLADDKLTIEFEEGENIEIHRRDIGGYHVFPGGVLIPVEGKRAGWLWLPMKAFDSPESFSQFLKSLYRQQQIEISAI